MKKIVTDYKNNMIYIFNQKYGIPISVAKKWIEQYNFDEMLVKCNYIALHDDPEVWVDAIYKAMNFVYEFNDVEIRKCTRSCSCKVCDREVRDKDIVYLKSFRLQAQPFHICLDCWEKINVLVEQYKEEKVNQKFV